MFPSSKTHSHRPKHHGKHDATKLEYVKVTMENLLGILEDPKYRDGVDPDTMRDCLSDLYGYIAGDRSNCIRCPAPTEEPGDIQTMWGEGTKIRTAAPASNSGRGSKSASRPPTSLSTNRDSFFNRARSVTSGGSSSYTRRYVGFDDEFEDRPIRAFPRRRDSVSSAQRPYSGHDVPGAVRVGGTTLKPTQSIEDMINRREPSIEDEDDGSGRSARPPARPPARPRGDGVQQRPSGRVGGRTAVGFA